MNEMMKVLYIQVRKRPQVIEIKHTLKEMQRLVGGIISAYSPFDDGSGKITLIKNLLGLNKPVSGSLETALDLKKSAICRSRPRFSGIFPQQSAKLLCRALRVNAVTVRFTARHKGQMRSLICAKWE